MLVVGQDMDLDIADLGDQRIVARNRAGAGPRLRRCGRAPPAEARAARSRCCSAGSRIARPAPARSAAPHAENGQGRRRRRSALRSAPWRQIVDRLPAALSGLDPLPRGDRTSGPCPRPSSARGRDRQRRESHRQRPGAAGSRARLRHPSARRANGSASAVRRNFSRIKARCSRAAAPSRLFAGIWSSVASACSRSPRSAAAHA